MPSSITAVIKKPPKRRYQNVASHAGTDGSDTLASQIPSPSQSSDCLEDYEQPTQLSIDVAIDRLGMGPFQYRILVATGLCFAADAMEILLLSFLSIILRNEWHLTENETAFITSMLFLGALVGTSILGPLADKFGRRPVFLFASTLISVMGAGTSLAANYEMILAIMFVIGFGIGGLTVPFDTLAEFLPAKGRGTNLLLIEYFWTIGCLLVIVFAELTLAHGRANWRVFVFLCSLPCCASVVVGYLFCPESVRWLASVGRSEEALDILRKAARVNKLTATLTQESNREDDDNNSQTEDVDLIFPLGMEVRSDEDHSGANSASCLDLLKPQWRGTILKLWGTWGGFALGYYGAILSITKVFESDGSLREKDMLSNATVSNETMLASGDASFTKSEDFDYSAIFISSSAELVGTTLVIILVDRVGRIPSQVVCYLVAGACIFLLCTLADTAKSSGDAASDRWKLVVLGFILRAMDMAATCTSWVMTAEVLSTEIRTTGHASANAVARMGAFFSPFVVNMLPLQSLGITMLVVHWFAAACVSFLPETKGAAMGTGGGGGEHNENSDRSGENGEMNGIFVIDEDDDESGN